MANIPTYQAGDSVLTGGLAVHDNGSAAQIGEAGQALASGMMRLSSVGSDLVLRQAQKAKALKDMDNARWVSEAYENEKLLLAQEMGKEENANAEDISDRVVKFSAGRMAEYTMENAPSPEAYKLFKQHYGQWSNSRAIAAVDVGFQNKLRANIVSTGKSITSGVEAYRSLSHSPNEAAATALDSYAQISSAIEAGYSRHSPDIAKKLHEDLTTQFVLTTMGDSPGLAKTILDNAQGIDEQTRHTLETQIGQAVRTNNSQQHGAFLERLKSEQVMADGNQPFDQAPIEEYLLHMTSEQAKELKAEQDRKLKTLADRNLVLGVSKGWSPEALTDLYQKVTDPKRLKQETAVQQKELADALVPRIVANLKQAQEDAVEYLGSQNAVIAGLQEKAAKATGAQRSAAIQAVVDAKKAYQGAPPRDQNGKLMVSETEAKQYLNLSHVSLLSDKEALQLGGDLNTVEPKKIVEKIGELLLTYPKPEDQDIVLNDLVSRGKLNESYQVAWLIKDFYYVDKYLADLQDGKNIKVSEKEKKELEDGLMSAMGKLRSNVSPSSFSGYVAGAKQFAAGYVSRGDTVKVAVEKVNRLLFENTMGYTKVNDRPLMVLKSRNGKGSDRTDKEVTAIGNNLHYALAHVPIQEINDKSFRAAPGYEALPDTEKQRAIGNTLLAKGYWLPDDSGQGAYLWAKGDDGNDYQVTDKQEKKFHVQYDNLPNLNVLDTEEWSTYAMQAARAGATTFPPYQRKANTTKPRPSWLETK